VGEERPKVATSLAYNIVTIFTRWEKRGATDRGVHFLCVLIRYLVNSINVGFLESLIRS